MDLSRFSGASLDRGRPVRIEAAWWVFKLLFVQSPMPWPSPVRVAVLRLFGASVGKNVYIRPRVNVHFPWKLIVGDNVWIGEGTTLLNLEPITLQSNSALAHEVYLAAAGHDISSPTFEYANEPIVIESGAWVATRAYVGPGVTVGIDAVVAAGAVVVSDVAPGSVVGGVPARVIGTRRLKEDVR